MAFGAFGFVPSPRGKGRLPFVVAAGLLVVLVGIGAVSLFGVMRAPVQPSGPGAISGGACGGLSVVGTPAVLDIIDPETGGSARVLKMSVTPNCAGTYVQGTFGSSFLRQTTGFDVDQGFTVTATAAEEKLLYPVVNDRITLYDYRDYCSSGGTVLPPEGYESMGAIGWGCYVRTTDTGLKLYGTFTAMRKAVGTKGHLAPIPSIRWFADMAIVTEDGQSITKRVSSQESRAEWTRDNATLAVATWTGNFVTGEAPPDATGVVAAYFEDVKKWNLASLAEWDAYKTVDTTLREYNPQTSSFSRWDGQIASAALAAIRASKATLPVPGQFTADGLGYEVTSAPRLQTPVIDLLIKGELLGLVRPQGIPDLAFVAVVPSPYHAGNPGTLTFRAVNLGNVSAGFAIGVSCGGSSLLASPLQVTLDPGAPKEIPVPFTVADAGNYQCEGVLTDLAGGAAAKSSRAVFALAVQVCQPGLQQFTKYSYMGTYLEKAPSGVTAPAALQQCKADGSGWETILDCSGVVVESYKANTCVAGLNFGLIGGKTNATPVQTKTWAEGGAQPPGSCKYTYEQGGVPCSVDDRFLGVTPEGMKLCQSLGTITPKTYETRASAPVQFKNGKFTCGGAMNSPLAKVLSVTEVPEAVAAVATPLPDVLPGQMAPASPPPGVAAPAGGAPPPTPGFEAVFAVAGLLFVSYCVSRWRRDG